MLLAEKYNEADLNAVKSYERMEGESNATISNIKTAYHKFKVSIEDLTKEYGSVLVNQALNLK